MSADRLADIKAREQAAFGGPWEALDADENGMHAVAVDGTVLVEVGDFCDAEFIAHAREDVPWLVDQVESLERWKFEACEVMSGLRELGKALGLRPGVQITGPAALAEVARLTAERDALAARLALVEALAAAHARESEKVWKVEEIMNDIEGSDPTTWERLRAALDTMGADQ